MAITYRLENYSVTFHWDRYTDNWTAKIDNIEDFNLEAKSFGAILRMFRQQYPEFTNSIQVFFPNVFKI